MIINHNIAALNTHRQLGVNTAASSKALEKLSSGLRINRAGDDAAGLAISEKMRGQIRGLEMAQKNAQDGISLIQTAEGALNETHSILQRMRELAVQSSNDTNTDKDRAELQKEVDQLAQELSRISNDTEFNTQNLAGGNFSGTFHIGANAGQSITLNIGAMDASTLGVARDGLTAEVADGATLLNGVTVGSTTGDAIVDSASIDVTAAQVTAGKGSHTIGGVTVETATNTDFYNDYEITVVDNTTEGIEIDHDAKTIIITADISNTPSAAEDLTVSHVNGSGPALTFSGTTPTAVGTGETMGADGTAGASADGFNVTFDDGTTQQTVFVAGSNATSVSVTSGDFQGLTLTTSGAIDATLSGTITVSTESAAAAQFSSDGSISSKAVAPKGIDISSQTSADSAITTIQSAIDTVSSERSKLGALQNRLEHTINNLGTSAENLTAAESRIRDVDYALAA